MNRMRRGTTITLIALAVASAPAMGQIGGSPGEAFLSALRGSNSGKALELVQGKGSTVVNYRGDDGDAGLHIVVRNRESGWIDYLLRNGANPDVGDKRGDTPLILAVRTGYVEAAALLLRAHAQVDKTNRLGETALIVAVQQRNVRMTSTLLELGANPDKPDHASGYSARDYAKRDSRSREMLRLIETLKSKVPVQAATAR
ncbi:MAG: ankyrin repeat domain-containing protein [Sphingomicrobium sp.]